MPDAPEPPEPRFNAMKHGCCARSPLLPGEDESLWREIEADWFTTYNPQTPISQTLVAEAALAFWVLGRNRRQFHRFQLSLATKDAPAWNEQDHLNYSRFLRYQTAAERSFSRAFKDLEYLRKSRMSEAEAQRRIEHALEDLQLRLAREQARLELDHARLAFDQQKHADKQAAAQAKPASSNTTTKKPKKETFEVTEQWVEVTITEGVTKTTYTPTNEEILDDLEDKEIEPKLVYRRLNFPDGIPSEYAWTNLHDPKTCEKTQNNIWCPLCSVHTVGGHGIQRMTFDTWRQVIERESKTPGQHAGPTGSGNLPRPKERGGDLDYAELLEFLKER